MSFITRAGAIVNNANGLLYHYQTVTEHTVLGCNLLSIDSGLSYNDREMDYMNRRTSVTTPPIGAESCDEMGSTERPAVKVSNSNEAGVNPPERATIAELLLPYRMATVVKTPLLVAIGLYLARGSFVIETVGTTMLLTSCLWMFLYVLNEAYDIRYESNKIVDRRITVALYILVAVTCAWGAVVSYKLFALLFAMAVGQIAYCAPPLRLKRCWWAAPLLSGAVNPVLRLWCGVIWGTALVSPVALAALISLHLGSSLRTRTLRHKRDQSLGYGTVTDGATPASKVLVAFGFLLSFYMCYAGIIPQLFAIPIALGAVFAYRAWSRKVTDIAHLRWGWIWFAFIAAVIIAVLIMKS